MLLQSTPIFPQINVDSSEQLYGGIKVDSYILGTHQVNVIFYTPFKYIYNHYPDYDSCSQDSQTNIWLEALHNSVIYVFNTVNIQKNIFYSFVVRGDPTVKDSAAFYRIEIKLYDSTTDLSQNFFEKHSGVKKTFLEKSIHGTIFEHLFPEKDRKEMAGLKIKFNDVLMRVVPYEEIKISVNKAVKNYFSIK